MLTEVDVPNPNGALRPGLYVDVAFSIPRQQPGIVIPDEAIVFNARGLQVATVEADDTVKFHKIDILRDFGTSAELRSGLQGGETLVLSPPTQLADGGKVKPDKPRGSNQGKDTGKQTASQ